MMILRSSHPTVLKVHLYANYHYKVAGLITKKKLAQNTKGQLIPIKISKYIKIHNRDNEDNHKLNSSSYT